MMKNFVSSLKILTRINNVDLKLYKDIPWSFHITNVFIIILNFNLTSRRSSSDLFEIRIIKIFTMYVNDHEMSLNIHENKVNKK